MTTESGPRTRKPSGEVAFPLLLVEGEEKAGKTFAALQLSSSPRVGTTYVLDTGDGTTDEYATLGEYLILEHNGTWSSQIGAIKDACAVPSDPAKPNVVIVDSGSLVWGLLKSWADSRARNSKKAREALSRDPDAEIDTSMNYWNDAKDRWADLLRTLKAYPGIAIITATGREVTKVENGAPTRDTEWSVDIEKTTPGWVQAWVRIRRPHAARLVAVRSLTVDVPANGLELPSAHMLDHVIFDVLGAGRPFGTSQAVPPVVGTAIPEAKRAVIEAVQRAVDGITPANAKAEAGRLWTAAGLPNGSGEVPTADLTALLVAIGDGSALAPESPPEAPSGSVAPSNAPPAPGGPGRATATLEVPGKLEAAHLLVSDLDDDAVDAECEARGLGNVGSSERRRGRLAEAIAAEEG